MIERRSTGRPLRAAFSLLCWEGAFAVAYDTWTGATYLSGLAGELNVSMGVLAFVASLPWLGSAGQLLGFCVFRRFRSPRRYTLAVATIARSLWLFPAASALWLGIRAWFWGEPFPVAAWFTWLAVFSACASLLQSSSSMAWMSWMQELIPPGLRARYFGARQSYGMAALF